MAKGEYYSKWLMTLEKSREIIHHEFSSLTDDQLNYHVHIHNCSIVEILDNLVNIQKKVIQQIDRYMDNPVNKHIQQEYQPGYFSRFIIRLSVGMKCKPAKACKKPCFGDLTRELMDQGLQLERLIRRSTGYNINKRIIRYGFLNAVRLSMGDGFELITKCQKKHVILARRVLMLQNL